MNIVDFSVSCFLTFWNTITEGIFFSPIYLTHMVQKFNGHSYSNQGGRLNGGGLHVVKCTGKEKLMPYHEL